LANLKSAKWCTSAPLTKSNLTQPIQT
jgi:hypothetical protein